MPNRIQASRVLALSQKYYPILFNSDYMSSNYDILPTLCSCMFWALYLVPIVMSWHLPRGFTLHISSFWPGLIAVTVFELFTIWIKCLNLLIILLHMVGSCSLQSGPTMSTSFHLFSVFYCNVNNIYRDDLWLKLRARHRFIVLDCL